MLKKIIYLSVLTTLLFCFACQDKEEETVTPKADIDLRRTNVIGDWILESTTRGIRADGSVGLTIKDTLSISFLPEGTGYRYTDTATIAFTWLYQGDPDKVILINNHALLPTIFNSQNHRIYDVTTNQENKQTWKYTLTNNFTIWHKIEDTWQMKKQ